MAKRHKGQVKKVATQKVPATQLVAATHTRKPGYVTSPKNVAAAGAYTYAHRDGSGPKNGYGSADVSRERSTGVDNPKTYYKPDTRQTARKI